MDKRPIRRTMSPKRRGSRHMGDGISPEAARRVEGRSSRRAEDFRECRREVGAQANIDAVLKHAQEAVAAQSILEQIEALGKLTERLRRHVVDIGVTLGYVKD